MNNDTPMGANKKLIKEIVEKHNKWKRLTREQIKRVRERREYVYNVENEQSIINGRTEDSETFTINMIRTPTNRVKTDFRKEQPRFEIEKKNERATDEEMRIFQHLFDSQVMNRNNVQSFYDVADNIIDLSMAIFEVGIEYESERLTTLDKRIVVRSVEEEDFENYFFDCDTPLRNINHEGRYQGRVLHVSRSELERMKDITGNYIKLPNKVARSNNFTWQKKDDKYCMIDYYERYYREATLGHYYVPGNPNPVLIEKDKFKEDQKLPKELRQYVGYEYLGESIKVGGKSYRFKDIKKWVYDVHHYMIFDDKILVSEVVDSGVFPFLVNFGMLATDNADKKPVLVPFYDHVIDVQKMLDYSASCTVYALQMSALGDKYLIPNGTVSEEDRPGWENRNTSDGDLHYDPYVDANGNVIPGLRPEKQQGQELPPIAQYLMQSAPTLIQGMLGTHLENELDANTSGKALNMRTLMQMESARIYRDYAFQAMVDAGERIKELLPFAFDNERTINMEVNGVSQLKTINKQTGTDMRINDISRMQETYNLTVALGSTPEVRKEQTRQSLEMFYQGLPQVQSQQAAAATMDIFAGSLSFPQADEVARRMSAFMDPDLVALGSGVMTVQQYQQKKQEEQVEEQQNNPQVQLENKKMQTEQMKENTKQMEAHVELSKAQNEVQVAGINAEADKLNAKARMIAAQAEISKSLTSQEQ